jgi:hypothetical protein
MPWTISLPWDSRTIAIGCEQRRRKRWRSGPLSCRILHELKVSWRWKDRTTEALRLNAFR